MGGLAEALQMAQTAVHGDQEVVRQQTNFKTGFGLTIREKYRAFCCLHQKTPSAGRVFFLRSG
jgi:hypothetical protein